MSNATLASLRSTIEQASVTAAWRQWAALRAGAASNEPATAIVDPEALVMVSLGLEASEPRLWDVAASWVSKNDGLLSVQRLRNLSESFPFTARKRLPEIAMHAFESSRDARWKKLIGHGIVLHAKTIRGGRNRAGEMTFPHPALLWLQLRAGIGVGVRADVLACLIGLGGEWRSATDLSEALAYKAGSVRNVLEDLSQAQFIRALPTNETDRRSTTVVSVAVTRWLPLLGLETPLPRWCPWAAWYALAADLLAWIDEIRGREVSGYALGVKGREFVGRHRAAFVGARGGGLPEPEATRQWPRAFEEEIQLVARAMIERV